MGTLQKATSLISILGGLAVALLAASPSAAMAAAPSEYPAPGDTLIHTVRAGDTLNALSVHYRAQAGWYGQADCLAAIRRANGLEHSHLLRIGQKLQVPVQRDADPVRTVDPVVAGAGLRGLYLPAPICGYQAVFARVDSFTAAGGNGVVFDAKDIDGGVSFGSAHPLAVWGKGRPVPMIPNLDDLITRIGNRIGLENITRLLPADSHIPEHSFITAPAAQS